MIKWLFNRLSPERQKEFIVDSLMTILKSKDNSIDQVTAIRVEEGEWLRYADFTALMQQLRGGKPEDRQLQILMNPVDPDCFVNEMLVMPKPDKVIAYFPGSKRPKVFEKNITTKFEYDGKTETVDIKVLVVLSTHHDNPYITLAQRASIEQMKETDHEKWLQLAEARFIRPSGTFFKEFDPNIHVVEPFPIPKHWNVYTTKDYGLDMLAQYWIAIDTHGTAYVYKELYESDLIISDAAKRIKEVNGTDKPLIKYAPPDLWNRRQETGRSAIDIFREHGEVCVKSSNDRVDGWLAMKEWLKVFDSKDIETGLPTQDTKMKIFSNCENLIRCIPKLQRAEHDPNDVDSKTDHEITHGPDSIRGFCIMRQRSADPLKEERIDAFNQRAEKGRSYLGGEVDDSYL